jgi:hypothetical protein
MFLYPDFVGSIYLTTDSVGHARYIAFQMAKVAFPRNLFADSLSRVVELRLPVE